uniref:RBR-type E3 ubiquitin transferase n=2 Tax=Octopus bimaculoides TaxID=37653 RepID=A0A0L8I875_OCTBM
MDNDERAEELVAISSIYEEDIFLPSLDDYGGQFVAKLKLPQPFSVKIQSSDSDSASANITEKLNHIKHLPPLVLNFQLPTGYPSHHAPIFTLSCKWLSKSQLDILCKRLDQVYQENNGMVVLFLWFDVLENETFDLLGLKVPLDLSSVVSNSVGTKHNEDTDGQFDPRGIQDIASQDLLLPTILDYNNQENQRQFSKTLFTCNICFCDKLGSKCIKLDSCEHVFCKDCMKEYFTINIKDGNINGLQCPTDKCESKIHPSQVKSLVDPDVFSRYDYLLLQLGLQTMTDLVYCPRPACGQPVILDRGCNIGNCPSCNLVFCSLCRLTYHGLSNCKMKSEDRQKLKDEYLGADAETKHILEKRFGKKHLQDIVDESFSQEWLEQHSKQCPHCNTYIQKIDGCNKMACSKCNAFFCWLCMETLPRNSPYIHFSSSASPCFNRLFEGVDIDDDFHDVDFFL